MKKLGNKFRISASSGFTLIEVMIVVAIIAILAAIAVPQYSQYIIKSHNAAAQSFLMDIVQKEEQYLLDSRSYAPDLATLGITNAAIPQDVSTYYQTPPNFIMGAGNASYQIVLAPIVGGKMDGTGPYQGTLTISNTNPTASISN